MNIEYHKWWSPNLNQEMEIIVYGHAGMPTLIFPCQGGRFFEWEDFGMFEACRSFIDRGKFQFFTVDSVDNQSWANFGIHPSERARRHEDYDRYIIHEVAPFIDNRSTSNQVITLGCSMGAFHASNFFFRHPDVFNSMIAISGLFQLNMFSGDYMDDNIYFNTPLAYLPNLIDAWYLERYRHSNIIFCVGQGAWEGPMLADATAIKQVLDNKNIPNWVDIWGYDVNHDWPWWRKMVPYFLAHLEQSPQVRSRLSNNA
jgi:esterase/lipase superfamily enzyme